MPNYNTIEDYELAEDYLELDVPCPLPIRHYSSDTPIKLPYPTAPKVAVRVCECGTHLSRYNKNTYCASCGSKKRKR